MIGKGAILALGLLAACAAQESAPASRRATRPATEYTTADGLRVRIVPADVPGEVVVILGVQGAGILAEPAGIPHLAHVSEHAICHSGLAPYRAAELMPQGRGNAETLANFMYFDLYPDAKTPDIADALRAQNRRFVGGPVDESVLEREKPLALAEVTQLEATRTDLSDYLGKFAWSAFRQIAFHGATDVPFRGRTAAITTRDVERFLAARFRAHDAMLTIAGDVDPRAIRESVPGAWVASRPRADPEPVAEMKPGVLKGSWDVASHQFFMAWPAPPPSDSAHPALRAASDILNLRLDQARELRNLARGHPSVHAEAGGIFVVQLPLLSSGGGEAAAAEVRKVLDASTSGKIGPTLLASAKRSARLVAGNGLEAVAPISQLPRKIMVLANIELARMRATLAWGQSPEEYCARVDQVTEDDVKAAIKTWLAPEKATIVTIAGKE